MLPKTLDVQRWEKGTHRGIPLSHVCTNSTLRSHLNNISKLTSIAVASARIHSLRLEQKKKIVSIRPQLHLIIRAPTGQLKSTILDSLAEANGVEVMSEISRPGLVGSIDSKNYQLIEGEAWTCRNKILLIDEFRFRRQSDDWTVFLQLLEDQRYNRKLGMFSSESDNTEGDLFLRLKQGKISMRTRFACIIATMRRFDLARGEDFKAFVNRCVTYKYDLSLDEIEKVIRGAFDFKPISFNPPEEITIRRREYYRIIKFVRKVIDASPLGESVSKDNFSRTVGDICRVRAVTGKRDLEFERNIVQWKLETYAEIGKCYRHKKGVEG